VDADASFDVGASGFAVPVEVAQRSLDLESRTDRALGIIFVGPRVAEVDEYSIAEKLRDVPLEPLDGSRARILVGRQDLSKFFEVESLTELRGSDEITIDDGEVSAFTIVIRL
jgi:hypothetical protein